MVFSHHGNARYFLGGNRPLWYILLRYSATAVINVWYILYFVFFWVTPACAWCCGASTFTEHENHQASDLNMKCVVRVRVCVFFSFIYSGRQIRWKLLLLFVVFFTLTDRASTIPSNIRGCQSGTWSAGQKKIIRGTPAKLQREQEKNTTTKTKTTKRKEQKQNTHARKR